MSFGEIAFLAMVVGAFATFIGVVGFMSVWSRRPNVQTAEVQHQSHASVQPFVPRKAA